MEIFPVRPYRNGVIWVNYIIKLKTTSTFKHKTVRNKCHFLFLWSFSDGEQSKIQDRQHLTAPSCTSGRSWLRLLAGSGSSMRQALLRTQHPCVPQPQRRVVPWAVPGTGQLGTHKEGTQKGSYEDMWSCGFQAALQGHTGDPQDKRSWSVKWTEKTWTEQVRPLPHTQTNITVREQQHWNVP